MPAVEFNYMLPDGREVEVHASAEVHEGDFWDPRKTMGALFVDVYSDASELKELIKDDLGRAVWDAIEEDACDRIYEAYDAMKDGECVCA